MEKKWAESCADQAFHYGYENASAADMVFLIVEEIRKNGFIQQVTVVGDLLRQWRKGLHVEDSMRVDDPEVTADEELLWTVIREIERARTRPNDEDRAFHLREAEAYLRTYWKRRKKVQIRNRQDLGRHDRRARTVNSTSMTTATTSWPWSGYHGYYWGQQNG